MGLGIIRKQIEKRKEEKELAAREIHHEYPKDLPDQLRIKALIDVSNTAFILYGDHLNFTYPGKSHLVNKISTFDLFGLNVIRAYVTNLETNEESVLQFNGTKESGEYELLDIILFRLADTIYPQSQEEWDEWLNDKDGTIGYQTLEFKKEGETVTFERDWDAEGGDHVNAVEIKEVVFTDPYETPDYVSRSAMLYAREIAESPEYSLLGEGDEYEYALAEVVEEQDGPRIEMSFGIIIEIANVEIH